jgi:hypothetical protein
MRRDDEIEAASATLELPTPDWLYQELTDAEAPDFKRRMDTIVELLKPPRVAERSCRNDI